VRASVSWGARSGSVSLLRAFFSMKKGLNHDSLDRPSSSRLRRFNRFAACDGGRLLFWPVCIRAIVFVASRDPIGSSLQSVCRDPVEPVSHPSIACLDSIVQQL